MMKAELSLEERRKMVDQMRQNKRNAKLMDKTEIRYNVVNADPDRGKRIERERAQSMMNQEFERAYGKARNSLSNTFMSLKAS